MADEQATIRAKPRDGPFHDPAMPIGAQPTFVFVGPDDAIVPIGRGEHDPPRGQVRPQRVAIVGPIPEQVARVPAMRRYARGERRVDERDFRGRRRGNGDSHRKTLTLDQYHAL